jgi:hypothetical protein
MVPLGGGLCACPPGIRGKAPYFIGKELTAMVSQYALCILSVRGSIRKVLNGLHVLDWQGNF